MLKDEIDKMPRFETKQHKPEPKKEIKKIKTTKQKPNSEFDDDIIAFITI
jgi:hypothetical protein